MHAAPAHLEAKLRFYELSVGQIAGILCGLLAGIVWALLISPLHGMINALSGAYLAALPAVPVFVASQTEFDLGALVVGAARWRRMEGRYAPGPGAAPQGYVAVAEPAYHDVVGEHGGLPGLDLQALWDEPGPARHDQRS